jgi:predicted glycosyltransferase
MRPRLLFYCQHSVGMGHLMRSVALTRALSARFDVTFVSGGAVPHVAATRRLQMVLLPPVGVDESGALVSRDRRRRLDRALEAVSVRAPQVRVRARAHAGDRAAVGAAADRLLQLA